MANLAPAFQDVLHKGQQFLNNPQSYSQAQAVLRHAYQLAQTPSDQALARRWVWLSLLAEGYPVLVQQHHTALKLGINAMRREQFKDAAETFLKIIQQVKSADVAIPLSLLWLRGEAMAHHVAQQLAVVNPVSLQARVPFFHKDIEPLAPILVDYPDLQPVYATWQSNERQIASGQATPVSNETTMRFPHLDSTTIMPLGGYSGATVRLDPSQSLPVIHPTHNAEVTVMNYSNDVTVIQSNQHPIGNPEWYVDYVPPAPPSSPPHDIPVLPPVEEPASSQPKWTKSPAVWVGPGIVMLFSVLFGGYKVFTSNDAPANQQSASVASVPLPSVTSAGVADGMIIPTAIATANVPTPTPNRTATPISFEIPDTKPIVQQIFAGESFPYGLTVPMKATNSAISIKDVKQRQFSLGHNTGKTILLGIDSVTANTLVLQLATLPDDISQSEFVLAKAPQPEWVLVIDDVAQNQFQIAFGETRTIKGVTTDNAKYREANLQRQLCVSV